MDITKRMNRSWENYSREQVLELEQETKPEVYASDWTASKESNKNQELVGKAVEIICEDGLTLDYKFVEANTLLWRDEKGTYEAFYKAYPIPGHPEVFFVHHIRDNIQPVTCVDLILDMEEQLATVIIARLAVDSDYPRDVEHSIHFGWIDGRNEKTLHGFSTDLVGKAILWEMPSYTGKPPIKHIYLSPMYYGIYMTRDDECYMTADPADYIKLKDNLYLISIIEKHRSGIQLTFTINTELIEDVVGHFGISAGNELDGSKPKLVCTMITGRKGRFVPMETV